MAADQRQEDARLATALFPHAAAKGGQGSIDREKINSIVLSLTKESKYTKEKLSHHLDAEKWVNDAKKKLEKLDRVRLSVLNHEIAQKTTTLEASRQQRVCCVVDFDMFFAAVEIRDRPELKDLPVAVGGIGMISTTNYVARKWGVRSAMPGFVGKELCRRGPEFGMPKAELVFVKPNYQKYQAASDLAKGIFKDYDPDFRSLSLDEAYLDLTSHFESTQKDPMSILNEIRQRVSEATGGLTLSGGIGPNFRLAKIAADVQKPNGQFEIGASRAQVLAFLRDLPVRKVGGVGRVLEHKLHAALGIETCGDLLESLPQMYHCFGPSKSREFLHSVALGVVLEDDDDHDFSIGNERTFQPTSDSKELHEKLKDLCTLTMDRVAAGLETYGRPRKCALKVKLDNFKVLTRTAPDVAAFSTKDVLLARLAPLLVAEAKNVPLRLVGVRCFDFEKNKRSLQLKGQPTIDDAFLRAAPPPKKRTKESWRPHANDIDPNILKELPLDLQREFGGPPARNKPAASKPTIIDQLRPPPPPREEEEEDASSDDALTAHLIDMGFHQDRVAALLRRQKKQRRSSDPLPGLIEALLADEAAS